LSKNFFNFILAQEATVVDILLVPLGQGFSKPHDLDFCFLATASTSKVFRSYIPSPDLNFLMSLSIYLSVTQSRRSKTGFLTHFFDDVPKNPCLPIPIKADCLT
jgi:hypothetical protein